MRDILIDGYTLYVDDEGGLVTEGGSGGLYHRDTRHLSTFDVNVAGETLTPLRAEIDGSDRRRAVASNVGTGLNDVDSPGTAKRASLVAERDQRVTEAGGLSHRLSLTSYGTPFEGRLEIALDADFADVFEVRGLTPDIERTVETTVEETAVRYEYTYQDTQDRPQTRTTVVSFDEAPDGLGPAGAAFDVELEPGETVDVDVSVQPTVTADGEAPPGSPERGGFEAPSAETGSDRFDDVLSRAIADLDALTTQTTHGPVPLAGAPWFATVFGRDSLITALQTLPVDPSLARGTLRYLAAQRGTTTDEHSEERPGKIFHEERQGELAQRAMIPHLPYYGTIDATPLWVCLLAETRRWTGDRALVRELKEPLDDALAWADAAVDRHGDDPFLYYDRTSEAGLEHKAWRDTPGAVQHPDGEEAQPPIASVEVQGYLHRAYRDAAELFEESLDDADRAADLRTRADRLATAFGETFWLPDREFYAVAKDGTGAVVPTITSNVGHCLWGEIVPSERADAVVETLLGDAMFTGRGIRTVEPDAVGYSPASYHLGSVWPHDTSLIALGCAAYGRYEAADRLGRAVFETGASLDNDRLPELVCGFDESTPVATYPASCVPQAWSAGAPFATLRAASGLSPDGTVARSPSFVAESTVTALAGDDPTGIGD